jgi:ribosome biogenesis GTPase / thiamine phosphate phosphatase
VIVVNKADLVHDAIEVNDRIASIVFGVPIHAVSARSLTLLHNLERFFDGNRTIALVGSSGLGKSTLTNLLLGRAAQATQEVRAHDSRGRHTTTHRQLFTRPGGGSIIDTPGMRALEAWHAPAEGGSTFKDIEALSAQCKFSDCGHRSEPGCAVRAAVDRGDLDAGRADSYAAVARIETDRSATSMAGLTRHGHQDRPLREDSGQFRALAPNSC